MKKIMTILYATIFTSGILAGCSGNTTNNAANTTESNGTNQTETKSDLLSSSYADIMKNGKYFIHYNADTKVEEKTIKSETEMAVDGSSILMKTAADGINTRMLIKDKTLYVFNDAKKTYYKMTISDTGSGTTSSVRDEKIDTSGITYAGKGKAELNGKEMDYEEYKTDKGTIRYYFDNKKLYAIVIKSGDVETTMLIIELSNKVSADMFEIPTGYTEGETVY
ncbi:MAG TPA: hypothetical protein VIK34_07840 [Clostridiaceae bacterium]